MEKVTKEMREQLRKPLPKEAISQHPTKTFMSSIKAIYVEERLNEVFGIGSWLTKVEHVVTEKSQKANKNGTFPLMVVVKLTFQVPEYGIYHECYGGNDNEDLGDAFKGATTDAITKVGSYLEIGIDVFKGLKEEKKTVKKVMTVDEKKVFIAENLKLMHNELNTLEDYKEACLASTGLELEQANYDLIIKKLS